MEQQQTTTNQAPRRNPRGELGEGTRSDRLKALWRYARPGLSLKTWARQTAAKPGTLSEEELADPAGWLDVKSHVRTKEKRLLMKEAKARKRSKPKKPNSERRRVKGKSGVR